MNKDYYGQFLQALLHGDAAADPQIAALQAQPAFAVYRNTVFKGCADALMANYPAVRRLVGEAWMGAAALAYACANLPDDACLIAYGRTFPDFLSRLEQARELPYLPGVAALDRCWTESHLAADDPAIDADGLFAALSAGRDVRLAPHAAARWQWAAEHPCYSIWSANRNEDAALAQTPDWHGEGALLTRPDGQVQWQPLSVGACRFLDACRDGMGVAQAAGAALQSEPGMDIAATLGRLLQAGSFTSCASFH
ncbi:putative DNA-binding domain-containing protein [Herbaspirillum sp. LeCh32-8]|uniref:HvfC/BufC N-terminal domain-containing protein n=1 Tax=Herbaspirillum sp. LeCh32-8 TaxID=2821356 RepID=UPI001AE7F81A|nr:DNA-binding domain-containing protein [Herbaspirillum sp. LeCh32-8]MBP0596766.1 putative DNA-binding domain-containing protein [Herbaspirillum sp. LeCh32-8]